MLGSRGEEEPIMSCLGGRSCDGIRGMTSGDWLLSSCSLHLAKSDAKNPLRGGDDFIGVLGLCEGRTMGRGLV